jgi:hypothetical protein
MYGGDAQEYEGADNDAEITQVRSLHNAAEQFIAVVSDIGIVLPINQVWNMIRVRGQST